MTQPVKAEVCLGAHQSPTDFGAQRTEGCFVLGDPGEISTVFNSYLKIGDFLRGLKKNQI